MILTLVFLLLFLGLVIQCFFPTRNFSAPALTGNALITFVFGLIVLVVLWLIVGWVLAQTGIHLP